MKPSFTLENDTLLFPDGRRLSLYSEEAFHLISELWLKIGWNAHYHYSFTWMGQPALQLPEDLIALQEVIVANRPDVIIECGIAMGGSLLFYASICRSLGSGRVIGVDIDIRPHNRKAIEANPLSDLITLVQGSSTDQATLSDLNLEPDARVMVILDSNHGKEHVAKELELFSTVVTPGQYLVVADGFKKELHDVPRGKKEWLEDNPQSAIEKFLETHEEYILELPKKTYNRSSYKDRVTHFTKGWLKRASIVKS